MPKSAESVSMKKGEIKRKPEVETKLVKRRQGEARCFKRCTVVCFESGRGGGTR